MNTDFIQFKEELCANTKKVLYTGPIDELFNYCFGELDYRSLKFEHEVLDTENFQGNAGINYTSNKVPWTRIVEHKHFEFGNQEKTIITKEYSVKWEKGDEPYYPINDDSNNAKYQKYKNKADAIDWLLLGGRLAEYRYYDMHHIIEKALFLVREELSQDEFQSI